MIGLLCLLPAAGASSRMRGGDKLLEIVDGDACLLAMAKRAMKAGLDVLVTLPSQDHARAKVIENVAVRNCVVANPSEGMSASLRLGAALVSHEVDGLMILPPDMPAIETADIRKVCKAFQASPDSIVQATTSSGEPGHPIVFPRAMLKEFETLSGDSGAKQILRAHQAHIIFVELDNDRARLDLDTPEDWAAWRASIL